MRYKSPIFVFRISIALVLAVVFGLASPQVAQAARSINSVTLDGGSSVNAASAASISVDINVSVSGNGAGNRWYSTGWTIGSESDCVDHDDHSNETGNETFSVTAPSVDGTYDAVFTVYGTNNCNGNSTATTLTDAVVISSAMAACPDDSSYSLIFSDDFSDGNRDGWAPIEFDYSVSNYPGYSSVPDNGQTSNSEWNNDWTVASEELWWNRGGNNGSADEYGMLSYDLSGLYATSTISEYSIKTSINGYPDKAQNNDVGIVFGYTDDSNYYVLRWTKIGSSYSGNTSMPGTYRRLTLAQVSAGTATILASYDNFYDNGEFELKVTVRPDGIYACVDGNTLITYTGSSRPTLNLFGLYSYDNDNGVMFDDVEVRAIVATPIAEYRFEGCDWTTGAVVIDELGNHNGQVVQGAHTAPGINFGGGLCNVADLHNEGTDYNRYISLASNPISLNSDWTLMMWINFPPGFDHHYQYQNFRYSVIAGGTHDLAWIREHTTSGDRYWGASSSPSAHLAPFPSTLTGWHHVAFVGNGSNTDLYVDGAFYNTVDYKQTGQYTRMGTTADAVNTNGRQNLDTQLDELKFYDGALSPTEIASIYNLENSGLRWDGSPLNCELCGIVDHYRIEHTGIGLTCQRSDITLRACSNSDCSTEYSYPTTITLTPATANPPTWIGGDTQTFTGHQTFQLRQTTPGTVSLGLTNPDHVPTNGYTCYDSGVAGDCDIDFYDSGFIFDVPDLTSCQTSPTVSIQAVRTNDTTQTCIADGGFASTNKSVNFWSTYTNPATGTEQIALSGTNVATSSPGTGISLNFDANATASFTINYPDAGQMQLNARYEGVGTEEAGLVMLGADSFTARPVGLCVYSDDTNADCVAGNGSCSVFHKVDETFNLKVKGVCWEGAGDSDFCSGNSTTQNFRLNTIPMTHNLIAPTTAGVSSGSIAVSSIDIAAADNGEHVISNQTVSEVGVFTFTATPPNYFGSPLPAATSTNIGRFTPDHFVTSITNQGVFQDGCSGFTYSGQSFSYDPPNYPEMLITAVGSGGNTTVNYRDDFVKLTAPATQIAMPAVTSDTSNLGADGSTLLNLSWASAASSLVANDNGTLDFTLGADQFTYTREANALVAPFNSDIQLSVTSITDDDSIGATDLPRSFAPAATEIRYGRMQLQNAYGPETLPLTIPVVTEFYDGSAFTLNALDSCTPYDSLHLQPSNYQGNLTSGDTTATGSGTLLSGSGGNLSLSAPGVGHEGSVDLELDLSLATGLDLEWLQPDGNNPTAKATFGIFKGNQRLIYMRESVW